MIRIQPLLRFRFSSRKFYQIVTEQGFQKLPQAPQDAVLSKYIDEKMIKSADNNSYISQDMKWKKQNNNSLSYSELLSGSPHGSVQSFNYKNHEITLISTNYFKIDEKKIHKLLYKAKPDTILVQRRPDYHLHNFQLLPKGEDGIFSDRLYLNQLKFSPSSIKPIAPTMRPVHDTLVKSNVQNTLEKSPQKQILQQKGFQYGINYASSYPTPLYFSEIPMRSYRQRIANTHTLMQLQQIFKNICQRLPRYKNISFTPYQMGALIYPQIFLSINDRYMATIIQMLIAQKKHKKIVGIYGIVQNQAIRYYLQKNEALRPVIQYLIAPPPKGSIIRDIQNFEIIQKQILLDVLFFGKAVTEIKSNLFHTTNAVIAKYGTQINKQTMMKFKYDKIIQYLSMMDEKIMQGEEEIKKQFVRETLRDGNAYRGKK